MYLTQKNILKPSKEELRILNLLSYHTSRMRNVCTYNIRQHYFNNNSFLPYKEQYHQAKVDENFRLLLNDSSQQVIRLVDRDFKSFFALIRLKDKGKYSEEVKLPRYKKEQELSTILIQGRSCRIKDGFIHIGMSKGFKEKYNPEFREFKFKLPKHMKDIKKLKEVRILNKYNGKIWEIEYVYEKKIIPYILQKDNILGIDLGIDNFATCFDGNLGLSFIIDGKRIKSINQGYNKKLAKLQSIADRQGLKNTKRIIRSREKRNHQVNHFLNLTVKKITDYCIENNVGSIVSGHLENAKHKSKLAKKTKQNFQYLPYGKFKQKLSSKCEQLGIIYEDREESYTSKCSAYDLEEVKKHEKYVGRRTKRGLFKTKDKFLVNADSNGACNIVRKYLKSKHNLDLSRECVERLVNSPRKFKIIA